MHLQVHTSSAPSPRSPSNPACQGPGCRFREGTSWPMQGRKARDGTASKNCLLLVICCRRRARYYCTWPRNPSFAFKTWEQGPAMLSLSIRPLFLLSPQCININISPNSPIFLSHILDQTERTPPMSTTTKEKMLFAALYPPPGYRSWTHQV